MSFGGMSSRLEARIERVYMALTGASSARGAKAWFARKARITPRSVSRYLSGERGFDGPVASLLETLEGEANASGNHGKRGTHGNGSSA